MRTTVAGISGLRQLRMQLEEDAGDDFPEAVFTEILTLYDVCHTLHLNVFQIREVLGNAALLGIHNHLDATVILTVSLDDMEAEFGVMTS
ncbi:MAG: hypothetical protein AAF702_11905 [Chloroflexota bacterium]